MSFRFARAAACAGLLALSAAVFECARLGWADFLAARDTPAALRRAMRLAPDNPRYPARLAMFAANAGDVAGSIAGLERAVALSPRQSGFWIELGLRYEIADDLANAERCLLEAAGVDRRYEPRRTLANFYFRRGDSRRFWPAVRNAAEMAGGDMRPLFRLCWILSGDAATILERAIPDRPEALRQYTAFLLGKGDLPAAAAAASRLGALAGPDDAPVLLDACNRLLEARDSAAALAAWNALAGHGLIGAAALDPEHGRSLTNGSFATAPRSRGFDWRLPAFEGVSVSRDHANPFLRLSFSGRQPERCEPLWQYVPLLGSRQYRLEFRFRTEDVARPSGLLWVVSNAAGEELAESAGLWSEGWARGAVSFTAPVDLRLARIALVYRREPGSARAGGSLSIGDVRLELGP